MKTTRITLRRTGWLAALACAAALPTGAAAGPTIEYGSGSTLNISYSVQGWVQGRGYTSPTDGARSWDAYLRRNRLTFAGQHNDYLGYYAQLEGGIGRNGGDSSVYFRDAYVTFDYSDELRFIGGRFKNTFSRENLEACLEPLTMDRAEVLAYTPFAGTRDTGVAMWGNLLGAKLQYRVMLAEGRDSAYAPKDRPRVTARVHVSLWDPEFNYGYLGTYLGTQKVLTIGAAYDTQNDAAFANYLSRADIRNYKATTVDAFMELPHATGVYTLSGAVFKYDTGGAFGQAPDPELSANSDLKGWYVKAGYMLPGKVGPGRLQFFARHEKLDYGVTTGTAEYYDNTWNSIGAHYYIDGQRIKLSAEFAQIRFGTPHPVNHALRDYRQATIGAQFIF